jgi:hypothetical protein
LHQFDNQGNKNFPKPLTKGFFRCIFAPENREANVNLQTNLYNPKNWKNEKTK